MELLPSLIHKLKEQFEQNVPAHQMLVTVRMIESELSGVTSSSSSITPRPSSGKVSVVMPAGIRSVVAQEIAEQHMKYAPPVEAVVETMEKPLERNGTHHPHHNNKKQENSGWLFDPFQEIPTLAHQQSRELNDVI